jgi:iron-sulfur cluster protein
VRKTPSSRKQYRRQLGQAMADQFLNDTLERFFNLHRGNRQKAFVGLDFEALAKEVAAAKDASLTRMEELYEQFKKSAEAAGAQVHLAADAKEANRIIADIAARNRVEKIVKSKSMTAEETHLNEHLESLGLNVTETDLGEWIVQLRQETPSHMVAPAVHLSRAQVAELFTRVTGEDLDPDDIQALVKVARRHLRQAFLEADMGITGVNLALADTGTVGIVTNEGNARLVTTLPRVHVALAGLDKLLPDMQAALKVLKVLPRNAAGQIMSSYVTWVTGAVECTNAPQGRKETHIIFLDNGRLALARDPVFAEALRCVRCGACANVCPIYRLVGGYNYGFVYVGAIGLILTYFYHGREKARFYAQNCLNCQACKEVCAAGIDLPRLIKKIYARILSEQPLRPAKNMLLAAVLKNRRLFHFLLRRAYLAQRPLAKGQRLIRHLPLFFAKEHGFRSLPVVQKEPLRDRWPRIAPKVEKPRLKVALFGGCLIDFVYPHQAEAMLELLGDQEIGFEYPREQTCCGLPALMAAEEETAREVARQNLRAFDLESVDYVLTLCASCGSHLKESYPRLLADDPRWAKPAREMAAKLIDTSSFLKDVLGLKPASEPDPGQKAAYHAPCHLCRGLKVTEQPRQLLQDFGYQYQAYPDEEVCCGFGGSYSLEFPQVSARILGHKLDQVEATGAEVLVTDCPGCVLQLEGGLDQRGSAIKVRHLVEALHQAGSASQEPDK